MDYVARCDNMVNQEPEEGELGWQETRKYTLFYKWGIRNRLKIMASYASGKTLDIGWYQNPNMFLKEVIGLDVVKPAKLPFNYIKAYSIDINKPYPYPFEDNCFDTVVAGEVIEHIPDLDSFMKEIHRILKPNGVLIISTPNPASPTEVLVHFSKWLFGKIDLNMGTKGDYVHEFLFTNMITLLNVYGFKPIKMDGTYIQIPFTDIQICVNIQPLTYQTIYVARCRK